MLRNAAQRPNNNANTSERRKSAILSVREVSKGQFGLASLGSVVKKRHFLVVIRWLKKAVLGDY